MLKGVNKQILEITNTESPYFEKIIFFVRPDSSVTEEKVLRQEAEKISTSTATKPPRTKVKTKTIIVTAAYSMLTIAAGIAISFLFNRLLGGVL